MSINLRKEMFLSELNELLKTYSANIYPEYSEEEKTLEIRVYMEDVYDEKDVLVETDISFSL